MCHRARRVAPGRVVEEDECSYGERQKQDGCDRAPRDDSDYGREQENAAETEGRSRREHAVEVRRTFVVGRRDEPTPALRAERCLLRSREAAR